MKEESKAEIEELREERKRQQMLMAWSITGRRERGAVRTQERKPKSNIKNKLLKSTKENRYYGKHSKR